MTASAAAHTVAAVRSFFSSSPVVQKLSHPSLIHYYYVHPYDREHEQSKFPCSSLRFQDQEHSSGSGFGCRLQSAAA